MIVAGLLVATAVPLGLAFLGRRLDLPRLEPEPAVLRRAGMEARLRVGRDLRRGRPVTDPADARLAVALAAHQRRSVRWLRRGGVGLLVLQLLNLAVGVREDNREMIPLYAIYVGLFLASLAFLAVYGRRLARAEGANRRLLGELGQGGSGENRW